MGYNIGQANRNPKAPVGCRYIQQGGAQFPAYIYNRLILWNPLRILEDEQALGELRILRAEIKAFQSRPHPRSSSPGMYDGVKCR
jgi:hypothetical protein